MTAQLLTILCVMKFLHWADKPGMMPSYCGRFNLDNARRFYGLRNCHLLCTLNRWLNTNSCKLYRIHTSVGSSQQRNNDLISMQLRLSRIKTTRKHLQGRRIFSHFIRIWITTIMQLLLKVRVSHYAYLLLPFKSESA